jgi:hypothetical protein
MAAETLLKHQSVARGVATAVVKLVDRRPDASIEPQLWAFQREVEAVLYGNGYARQTGAVYRLLQRSGVGHCALALKKACVQQGIVTQHEFETMQDHLSDVRSFTLIPLTALGAALSTFGYDERSQALVAALDMDRPDDWPEEEAEEEGGEEGEGEGEEEEEEEEEAEEEAEAEEGEEEGEEDNNNEDAGGSGEGGEGGDGSEGANDDANSDGDVSVAETEVVDEHVVVGDEHEHEPAADQARSVVHSSKRQHVHAEPIEVTPQLKAELSAFEAYRAAPLNQARKGVAVAMATCESDKARVLRFMAWLRSTYKLKSPPTLGIFLHSNIGNAAKRYIQELVGMQGRKYSYTAKLAASFVAVANFVASRRVPGPDASAVQAVAQLTALHLQCRRQARQ